MSKIKKTSGDMYVKGTTYSLHFIKVVQTDAATMEINTDFSQNEIGRTTIWSSQSNVRHIPEEICTIL